MSTYLIGDIQGCDSALVRLLQHIDFSPSRDTLYLLGDLINRGPASADVLRRCMEYGDAVKPCWAITTCICWPVPMGCANPGGAILYKAFWMPMTARIYWSGWRNNLWPGAWKIPRGSSC